MSIFSRVYNWMARRNIGQWLGMTWDSYRDEAYNQQRDFENAVVSVAMQRAALERAEQALANGEFEQAARSAYRSLELLADISSTGVPGIHSLVVRAQDILTRVPSDTALPQPRREASVDEMLTTFSTIYELYRTGRLAEAKQLWGTAVGCKVVGDRKAKDQVTMAMASLAFVLGKADGVSSPNERDVR